MNIFHSRCHVIGKLCSLIIDGGSSVNVASLRLVEKLNLPILVERAQRKEIEKNREKNKKHGHVCEHPNKKRAT
ncbi:hypothetical protein CR513_22440, partial [Mucuna pruriens]